MKNYWKELTQSEIKYTYNYLCNTGKYPGLMCLNWYQMACDAFRSHQKFPEIYDFGFLYPSMVSFTPETGKDIFHIRENFDETFLKDILEDMDASLKFELKFKKKHETF